MGDLVGIQMGNYRLIKHLGSGGFASVYLGEHVYLGTQAAIKVLSTRLTNDEVAGFTAEARTVAHLNHPHIVRVLEFGVENGTPFLVMDYAPGGTLRRLYPKGSRLSPLTILPYVLQVADALQYAHDQKIIHRDVKPENMLLGAQNEVLLSDFGIATVSQSSRYEHTQEVAGTVSYMAPEQLLGKPRPSSDLYSLGVVTYEWLTGGQLFRGSFVEIASQHVLEPPPSLRAKIPTLPQAVEDVIFIALAKDPKDRFASMRAFARAFEGACKDVSTIIIPTVSGPTWTGPSPDIPTIGALPLGAPTVVSFRPSSEPPTISELSPTLISDDTRPPVSGLPPQSQNQGTPGIETPTPPGSPLTVLITPSVSGTPLTIVINPSTPGMPTNIGGMPPNAGGTVATPNGQFTIVINQSTPDGQTPPGGPFPPSAGGPTIIVNSSSPAPNIATPPSGFSPGPRTTPSSPAGRIGAFISYSHKDRNYLKELHAHLRYFERMREMVYWDDTRLTPGSNWREQIRQAIDFAKVAVLLISADFLASEFIAENELPPLLTAAQQEGAIILSVILRPSLFKHTNLAQFQTVNAPSQPLMGMSKVRRDQIWAEVAECIRLQQWQPK